MQGSFIEKLKNNKKIHFFVKAFKHIKQDEYLDFFINRENNPLLMEFHSLGRECQGKNIYLIREVGLGYGFFAEFHTLLQKLAFAERFKLIPYIIWNEDFLYHEEEKINGTTNGFEYFFNQPSHYQEQEIIQADMLTEAKMGQARWIEDRYDRGYDLTETYLDMVAGVFKKYIHLNKQTSQLLNHEIRELLGDNKTLAVHYRGTDFKANYDNHPVCVQIKQEIEAVKEAIRECEFEQIFLATDDKAAIEEFVDEFGSKVIYYTDVIRGDEKVSVAFSEVNRMHHHYLLAYEVLRDMYTLSACQGLIAGVSQVSICARIVKRAKSESYYFQRIIDSGKNHNKKEFTIYKRNN